MYLDIWYSYILFRVFPEDLGNDFSSKVDISKILGAVGLLTFSEGRKFSFAADIFASYGRNFVKLLSDINLMSSHIILEFNTFPTVDHIVVKNFPRFLG